MTGIAQTRATFTQPSAPTPKAEPSNLRRALAVAKDLEGTLTGAIAKEIASELLKPENLALLRLCVFRDPPSESALSASLRLVQGPAETSIGHFSDVAVDIRKVGSLMYVRHLTLQLPQHFPEKFAALWSGMREEFNEGLLKRPDDAVALEEARAKFDACLPAVSPPSGDISTFSSK